MSKAMTNYNEILDEILENLTTAASDGQFIEDGSIGEAKVDILDWHNKQIEEVLNRLEQVHRANPLWVGMTQRVIPLSAIEAERKRIKGE